jgi:hypothetical protein
MRRLTNFRRYDHRLARTTRVDGAGGGRAKPGGRTTNADLSPPANRAAQPLFASKLLGDEFQDFGGLAVYLGRVFADCSLTAFFLRDDGPGDRLIEHSPDRVITWDEALLDENPKDHKSSAQCRMRIRRVLEFCHFTTFLAVVIWAPRAVPILWNRDML